MTQTTQQPSHYPVEKPITLEFLNDWWFLLLAIASIVAYLVRLEVGVSGNKEAVKKLTDAELPLMKQSCVICKAEVDSKLHSNKTTFSAEIQNALVAQREFISAQIALVLEKLNMRDAQIQNLKEQTDRQGAELRKLGHDYYGNFHIRKTDDD